MNKLVLALATVAAFGLSTAAFAANPAASTSTTSTPRTAAHKMSASHHAGAKKHIVHRKVGHARHYRNNHGKRIAVKHGPAKKPTSMKTAS